MIVMKFGGTSVGTADMVQRVASIIRSSLHRKPVVVVSALSGVTDMLIEAAQRAARGRVSIQKIASRHERECRKLGLKLDAKEFEHLEHELQKIAAKKSASAADMDAVMSFGERLSANILAECARRNGIRAVALHAADAGFITDNAFGNAELLPGQERQISAAVTKLVREGNIPVVTGFLGRTREGQPTTLGRGGSDYTASLLGAAIQAQEIQVWTDVDGIMTADPKTVPAARTIGVLSFEEASELAYFGAKVLHPKTILPAVRRNIPVRVLNTFRPEGAGTTILPRAPNGLVKAVACKRRITLIHIYSTRMLLASGFLHKIFKVFDEQGVSVDMIATSEVSVSLTVDRGDSLEGVLKELRTVAEVRCKPGMSSISLVGSGIRKMHDVPARMFSALALQNIQIEMISQGASEVNIGVVTGSERAAEAVRAVHKEFFEMKGEQSKGVEG